MQKIWLIVALLLISFGRIHCSLVHADDQSVLLDPAVDDDHDDHEDDEEQKEDNKDGGVSLSDPFGQLSLSLYSCRNLDLLPTTDIFS